MLGSLEAAPFISQSLQATLSWILGLTIALANGMLPLIGVDIKTEDIDPENITAIETEPKNNS
jgi:hypothetical protein